MTTDNEAMQSYCRAMEAYRSEHDKDIAHVEQRIDSLGQLLSGRRDDLEKLMDAKFEAARRASQVEYAHTYITRVEVKERIDDLKADIDMLGQRMGKLENKVSGYDGRLAGVALFILVVSFGIQLLNLGG